MVNFFEKFGKHKKSENGKESSVDSPVSSGVRAKTGEARPTVPEGPLPGQNEQSPVAEAMQDCENWSKQEKKVDGMSEERAFKYVSGEGMLALGVLIPRMLGKKERGMRPDTFILLLEKLSKEHLKTVYENIKKTNTFRLLQEIANRDSSLVNRLIKLREKSGVNFNEPAENSFLTEVHSLELEEGDPKVFEKIDELRKELMQYGYEVVPTMGNEKETVVDLENLKQFVFKAEEYINLRTVRSKEDVEAEKKIGYDYRFDEGGYKIIFAKEAESKQIDDNIATIWAKMLIEGKARAVFNEFRNYLKEKYPSRFPDKNKTE